MAAQILIYGLAGYVDEFRATVVPGLHEVDTPAGVMTVVTTEAGEPLAVPSRNVFTPEGLAYAKEWSAKSGRSVFGVRVPDALAVK